MWGKGSKGEWEKENMKRETVKKSGEGERLRRNWGKTK